MIQPSKSMDYDKSMEANPAKFSAFIFFHRWMKPLHLDSSYSSQILPIKSLEGKVFTWGIEIINDAFHTSLVFKSG